MTITPDEAEAMVALALGELQDAVQVIRREAGGKADGTRFQALDDVRQMIRERMESRPDAFAALARLREVDRAEIERLTQERQMIVSHATMGGTDGVGLSLNDVSVRITALRNELYNEGKARAEALQARITMLEADRVKVAEVALRLAKDVAYSRNWTVTGDLILAITPAAVLAQADKEGRG